MRPAMFASADSSDLTGEGSPAPVPRAGSAAGRRAGGPQPVPPALGYGQHADPARAGQPFPAGRVQRVRSAGGIDMAQRLGRVDPQRHARRTAQRRGCGHRLDEPAMGRHLRQVDQRERRIRQQAAEPVQVDHAAAAGGQLGDGQPAAGEGGQVGSPLTRRHRHDAALVQRPCAEQRRPGRRSALGERQPARRDPEEAGQAGPALFQHRRRLGLRDVRAHRGLSLRVRRHGMQRRDRAPPGGGIQMDALRGQALRPPSLPPGAQRARRTRHCVRHLNSRTARRDAEPGVVRWSIRTERIMIGFGNQWTKKRSSATFATIFLPASGLRARG
jgi:hypothetical protein